MGWRVFIEGKYAGIVETNYAWASVYWAARARVENRKIELRKI